MAWKTCNTCLFKNLDVDKEPCFTCTDTPMHNGYKEAPAILCQCGHDATIGCSVCNTDYCIKCYLDHELRCAEQAENAYQRNISNQISEAQE